MHVFTFKISSFNASEFFLLIETFNRRLVSPVGKVREAWVRFLVDPALRDLKQLEEGATSVL